MEAKSLYGGVEEVNGVTIRVTAVRGRGFKIKKRRLGKKDDVPDLYCKIYIYREGRPPQASSECWKTPRIKDDTMPQWNDSRDYNNIDPARGVIRVDVYNENRGGKDEYLGSGKFSVENLLRKRLMEIELINDSAPTKSYVSLRCIQLAASDEKVGAVGDGNVAAVSDEEEKLARYELSLRNGNKTAAGNNDVGNEEDDDVLFPLSSRSAPPTFGKTSDDDEVSMSSTSSRSMKLKLRGSKLGKSISSLTSRKKKKKGAE